MRSINLPVRVAAILYGMLADFTENKPLRMFESVIISGVKWTLKAERLAGVIEVKSVGSVSEIATIESRIETIRREIDRSPYVLSRAAAASDRGGLQRLAMLREYEEKEGPRVEPLHRQIMELEDRLKEIRGGFEASFPLVGAPRDVPVSAPREPDPTEAKRKARREVLFGDLDVIDGGA